nr:protein emp47 [Quercus suber]
MKLRYFSHVAILSLALSTSAQTLIDNLSFGQTIPLASGGKVQNYDISSVNHNVQLLSDRIVLTPPVPGNARGALWSQSKASNAQWTAELEFRASGQDSGTGNLQVWYAADKNVINTHSLYTVEKFDGLALVIDQYGGTGGKIRGFLNDGSQDFRDQAQVESLAFGHCDYSYRNLGRPSKLRITSQNGLKVEVDGRECFRSDRISLPSDYFFGITGATSENPDSFEVNKFLVSSATSTQSQAPPRMQPPSDGPSLQKLDRFPGSPEALQDRAADEIKNQADQFADLHNRLQGLSHQIANMFYEFDALARRIDDKHNELRTTFPEFPTERLDTINRRIEGLEQSVRSVQQNVESKDYRPLFEDMKRDLAKVHGGLSSSIPEMTEKCKFLDCQHIFWNSVDADLGESDTQGRTSIGLADLHHGWRSGHAVWTLCLVQKTNQQCAEEVLVGDM